MNDLLFSIGLDVSDLRTSARAAKEQADDIKKGFKGFKDVLEFGGVGAAVFGFFKSVIDYAKELKGPLDENTAAVRRFADSVDEAKNTSLGWGAQFVGLLNRGGEGLGAVVRAMFDGKEAVREAAKTEREAAEAIAKIEAEKKKNGEEYKRIAEQIATLEKESVQIREKGLTTQEQFNLAAQRLEEIEKKRSAEGLTQIEQRRLDLDLQKASIDVLKLDAALTKESGEEAKKTSEAESKAREKNNELVEKKLKLQFEAMSTEEKIGKLAKDEEALRKTLAEFQRMGLDTTAQEVALLETQAALGKLRTEQTKDLEKAQAGVTQEIQAQVDAEREALRISIERRGRDDADLSDAVLRDKAATIAADVAARQAAQFGAIRGVGGMGAYDPFIFEQQTELQRVRAELQARDLIRSRVAAYGETGAARFYTGNMPEYERLLQFARDTPEAKKSTQLLEEINRRLSTVLEKN